MIFRYNAYNDIVPQRSFFYIGGSGQVIGDDHTFQCRDSAFKVLLVQIKKRFCDFPLVVSFVKKLFESEFATDLVVLVEIYKSGLLDGANSHGPDFAYLVCICCYLRLSLGRCRHCDVGLAAEVCKDEVYCQDNLQCKKPNIYSSPV